MLRAARAWHRSRQSRLGFDADLDVADTVELLVASGHAYEDLIHYPVELINLFAEKAGRRRRRELYEYALATTLAITSAFSGKPENLDILRGASSGAEASTDRVDQSEAKRAAQLVRSAQSMGAVLGRNGR